MISLSVGLALFLEVSASYKATEAHSWYYSIDENKYISSTTLPNVATQFTLGWENKEGWAFGYRHDSTPKGGCPLDCDGFEYTRDELFIRYKFGGIK